MLPAAPAAPVPVPPPPPPPAPAPVLEIRDFSDRIPAIVVKELRQGLRAKMFIIPFLALHAFLVMNMLAGAPRSPWFWVWNIIMLIALLPMRNVGALSEERQAGTLDTLLLTRLTPFRIVSGKWSATFALILLTAVSVAPYILVRYLNGGTSFILEGGLLLGLVFGSGAMAALFTFFSTMGSGLMRHILAIMIIVAALSGSSRLVADLHDSPETAASKMGLVLCGTIWITAFSLWQSATTIAPAAANLTTPRRLTTIAAAAITGLLLLWLSDIDKIGPRILIFILILSTLVETSERLNPNPVADANFRRRGLLGGFGALFLYPGWPSGTVFSAILWAVTASLISFTPGRWEDLALPIALSFFPVCIAAPLFLRRYGGPALMILILLAVQTLAMITAALLRGPAEDILRLIPLFPIGRSSSTFYPDMAFFWASVALLIAIPPLVQLVRRISAPPA